MRVLFVHYNPTEVNEAFRGAPDDGFGYAAFSSREIKNVENAVFCIAQQWIHVVRAGASEWHPVQFVHPYSVPWRKIGQEGHGEPALQVLYAVAVGDPEQHRFVLKRTSWIDEGAARRAPGESYRLWIYPSQRYAVACHPVAGLDGNAQDDEGGGCHKD